MIYDDETLDVCTHTMITPFYFCSMETVDLEFPINQGEDQIGDFCACNQVSCPHRGRKCEQGAKWPRLNGMN